MEAGPTKPDYWHGWRNAVGFPEILRDRTKNIHKVIWVLGDETRAWRCCTCGLMVPVAEFENLGPATRERIFTSDGWQLSPEEFQQVLWNIEVRPSWLAPWEGPATRPDLIDVISDGFKYAKGHINWDNPRLLPSEVGPY